MSFNQTTPFGQNPFSARYPGISPEAAWGFFGSSSPLGAPGMAPPISITPPQDFFQPLGQTTRPGQPSGRTAPGQTARRQKPEIWMDRMGKDVLRLGITVGGSILGGVVGAFLLPGAGIVLGAAVGTFLASALGQQVALNKVDWAMAALDGAVGAIPVGWAGNLALKWLGPVASRLGLELATDATGRLGMQMVRGAITGAAGGAVQGGVQGGAFAAVQQKRDNTANGWRVVEGTLSGIFGGLVGGAIFGALAEPLSRALGRRVTPDDMDDTPEQVPGGPDTPPNPGEGPTTPATGGTPPEPTTGADPAGTPPLDNAAPTPTQTPPVNEASTTPPPPVPPRKNVRLDAAEMDAALKVVKNELPYEFEVINAQGKVAKGKLNALERPLSQARQVALGDLHGSYEKLVETLMATRLVSMPKANAKRFVELAKKLEDVILQDPRLLRDTTLTEARTLRRELSEVIQSMQWVGKPDRQLVLIGDLLADRGLSDDITLEVLSHLKAKKPEGLVRLASNHDQAALEYLLDGSKTVAPMDSLERAFKLAEDPVALRQAYVDHLQELQLMHYNPEAKTLYTHAPITVDNLKALIEGMKRRDILPDDFKYEHITGDTLPDFIEEANKYYRTYVQYSLKAAKKNQGRYMEETQLFGDGRNGFLGSHSKLQDAAELPLQGKGVERLVHGHDIESLTGSPYSAEKSPRLTVQPTVDYQVVNLDQAARKDFRHKPTASEKPDNRLFIL